jgi:hypothetical protein
MTLRKTWMGCLAVGLISAAAVPAGAQDADAADPAAKAADEAVEQFVCRYERPTGSRRSVKVCRAKTAIEEDADGSRRAMDRMKHYANPTQADSAGI